ncbi:acyl transferase domain-containing protein [Aquimarina sp. MAR_2010_214]|uniref:type I polyketide synthase n=1 Tax=Aquimarina sp. MAR_2010_214 TaxID=1250026 RepID=UPI000C703607|nr:type I polyketide synthase [Aquimarina sp. MAR_2010_214]PKV49524.1 acyl transferase domain-containing protein [Aquimarina sp. MAR_2010_214]
MKRDIAIIGVSGRFPKSKDINTFWKNLVDEEELIYFFSEEELLEKGLKKKELESSDYIKAASFIENSHKFDYPFFRYTLDEAKVMNPQTRMMHQLVWEALEDSATDIDRYRKKIGIFVGANKDLNWSLHAALTENPNVDELMKSKLVNPNFMGSLIAYKMNFKGPCYFLDTACSTSLSTAHLACRSLLLNECGIALVGGIRLLSFEDNGYTYVPGSIMSHDGHNRSFDASSTGTIGADGAGVVVLKRLEEALKDGDHIYAVIKGSAMNNDGDSKAGYTMPSVQGQTECIKLAHKIAGVVPSDITYVEAHGTGTKIGDPIEIESLNIAFNNTTKHSCAIGSIKSNMGHADEAAGIAGLLKTTLALKHKTIPASIHYIKANPTIGFSEGPFHVNVKTKAWEKKEDKPLIAAVSSLGIGGTNVHMILGEAPQRDTSGEEVKYKLIRYSLKSESALDKYRIKLADFIDNNEEVNLMDLTYTFQVGRKSFYHGNFMVVQNKKDLLDQLRTKSIKSHELRPKQQMVFMFSGQGSQYFNMGKGLYNSIPLFKEIMDQGFNYLNKKTSQDYKTILYGEKDEAQKINQTAFTQPILFLFEYALAKVLMVYGLQPDYLIGHSLGEYTAACISGVFTLEVGLDIVCQRAALMASVEGGDMLSVGMPINEIPLEWIDQVSVAAINSPDTFVLSGTKEQMARVSDQLKEQEVPCTLLKTSHAFHSKMMETMLDEFEDKLKQVNFKPPTIPFISNLTGELISDEEATSIKYWSAHITGTVQFQKGIKHLMDMNYTLLVEVGPGNTLTTFSRQGMIPGDFNAAINTIKHPKDKMDDEKYFATFLGHLWVHGYDIDWQSFYEGKSFKKIPAPTYAFDAFELPTKVDVNELLQSGKTNRPVFIQKAETEDFLYVPSWKHVPAKKQKCLKETQDTYLFLSDGSERNSSLKVGLQSANKKVIEIRQDTEYRVSKDIVHFNLEDSRDWKKLWENLNQKGIQVSALIDTCTGRTEGTKIMDSFLNLLKGYLGSDHTHQLCFVILSEESCEVTGVENKKGYCEHIATMLQVATQENPLLNGGQLDWDGIGETEKLALQLVEEINRNEKFFRVAFRNGRRWLPYFETVPLEEGFENPIIQSNGVYLITGGSSEAEYFLAKHLLQKYDAQVIILSHQILADQLPNGKGTLWTELHQKYPKLSIEHSDLTNRETFTETVNNLISRFSRIDGIIHSHKDSEEITALVEELSTDILKKQSIARVDSLTYIGAIFKDRKPDFIKVISSLSSFLGGIAYGAYASVHTLMDQKSLYELQFEGDFSVLNLDRISEKDQWLREQELITAFEYSFQRTDLPQLLVSKRDINSPQKTFQQQMQQSIEVTMVNRLGLQNNFEPAETETQGAVIHLFEELFGLKGIGIQDDFFELGGDSLKGMMIINKIKKTMKVSLKISDLFSNSSVTAIAGLIEEKQWLQQDKEELNEMVI